MIDSLLQEIKHRFGEIYANFIFKETIVKDEFDSDCVVYDIKQIETVQSNIANKINNIQISQFINAFVENIELLSFSFSTGLIWFYWDYYKNTKELKQDKMSWNVNDYGGHSICDLYVNKKYSNYKIETLQYITIKEYNNKVLIKANAYCKSHKVKSMKPNKLCTRWKAFHYGNFTGQSPNFHHIQSIIMYCDFSHYCTLFSATFRAIEAYESLVSIRQRNSAFWWQSKSLREMVECYGAEGHRRGRKSGTFIQ
eukprot:473112_1